MIATQDYGWSQYAGRAGLTWPEATDWAMTQASAAGFTAWEPLLATPEAALRVGDLARRHGLALPSIFLTGVLHEAEAASATLARFYKTATVSTDYGCCQVMVYPSALPGDGDKSDPELAVQAAMLGRLALAMRSLGIQLCYHAEEAEMRCAAREFHHMLLATDPAEVTLCLDPDTIWRGAGQSQLALMDILSLYGRRTTALHLRQSRNGIWDEVFGPGDLDYPAICAALARLGARPSLILELALDIQTPKKLLPGPAHQRSLDHIRRHLVPIFGEA